MVYRNEKMELAEKICIELFTFYGRKKKIAKRLVMEFEDGPKLDGPGLNISATIGRIESILEDK